MPFSPKCFLCIKALKFLILASFPGSMHKLFTEKPHDNDPWDKVGYVNNIDSDIMIICDQYDQINKQENP